MRRISTFTFEQVIEYNLRDGGTAVSIFEDTQTYRVGKARWFVDALLQNIPGRAKIVEPGCSAGDISGWFSQENDVVGIDVVPAAVELSRKRYPNMTVIEARSEDVDPIECDVLVLCEFLEHISEPEEFVLRWLPKARYVLIGHPLNDPGGIEPGHIWSYTIEDYRDWYAMSGFYEIETHLFSGPFPEMVMGIGARK